MTSDEAINHLLHICRHSFWCRVGYETFAHASSWSSDCEFGLIRLVW